MSTKTGIRAKPAQMPWYGIVILFLMPWLRLRPPSTRSIDVQPYNRHTGGSAEGRS